MSDVEGYDGGDVIDCQECGHPVEDHTPKGCEAYIDDPMSGVKGASCNCSMRWTVKQIIDLRRQAGIKPADWRRHRQTL